MRREQAGGYALFPLERVGESARAYGPHATRRLEHAHRRRSVVERSGGHLAPSLLARRISSCEGEGDARRQGALEVSLRGGRHGGQVLSVRSGVYRLPLFGRRAGRLRVLHAEPDRP